MSIIDKRTTKYYLFSFLKYDLKASITVFFVALPLCLGISLASGAPVYSGLLAGIIGGIIVSVLSGSHLSVSGPAAGLTTITAVAITQLGGIEFFFLAVALAGLMQIVLGLFKLGGFTHFIPSAVIKGMLAAIGILLIAKQIPLFLGYDQPDFWTNELFNIITLDNAFSHIDTLYKHSSAGAILIAVLSLLVLVIWKTTVAKKVSFLPTSFVTVLFGVVLAVVFDKYIPSLRLQPNQYVNIPSNILHDIRLPDPSLLFSNPLIWKTAAIICFVASLETLLSIEAIDKLDAQHRSTPPNRELLAQGTGNFLSGVLGGIPVTAVIVRSSANAEAGARTKLSGIFHGIWLLLIVLFGASLVNQIPYSVLAVLLIRTGYNLAKPKMIRTVYKQGREQLMPFIVTVVAILFTDLLIGVGIGLLFSIYFIVKHTYRAGYTIEESADENGRHFIIELAMNVSFLNKKRISDMLEKIPANSTVTIIGTDSVYIDNDILEIIQDYQTQARGKKIKLILKDIREVETIGLH